VIAVGAPAPAVAASAPPCELAILPGSFKCCANGPDKTMYLNLQLGGTGSCSGAEQVCFVEPYVELSNGQPITNKTFIPERENTCVTPGEQFTILLTGVQSCAADLIFYTSEGPILVKSGNIPGGDETQCTTRAGG
jgi:hypothetical protein